tara:strand:+ start:88 stop:1623 length:1536 start_codon:yes stop_codon:yes gene_type:complete
MANGIDPPKSGVSSESTTSAPNWQTSMMNVNSNEYKSTLNKKTPQPVNSNISPVGNLSAPITAPKVNTQSIQDDVNTWKSSQAQEKARWNALTDDQKKEEQDKKLAEQQQKYAGSDYENYWKNYYGGYGGITTGAANIALGSGEEGEIAGGFIPGVGEAIDAKNTVKDLRAGDYSGAAMNAAGFLLPFVPGKAIKKFFGRKPKPEPPKLPHEYWKQTPTTTPTKIDTRPRRNKEQPAWLDDDTKSPDFDVVERLIKETETPNTQRRLKGLGIENPEDFTMHARSNIRYVDKLKEGAHYNPNTKEVNFGSNRHNSSFGHLGKDKDYVIGSHEFHGHGVQDYIRDHENYLAGSPYANDGRTWVDKDFQDWLKQNAPDAAHIQKHGYSNNPTTDYFLNSQSAKTKTGSFDGSSGVTPHGTKMGWSSEPLAHLSEMRREMGIALDRPFDDIFDLDDINRFSQTPLGKKNRVLGTGVPRNQTLASFLDKAPVSAGVIGTVGGYGLLRGQRNEQKTN